MPKRGREAAPRTLVEAIRYFSHPDTCLNFMVSLRWPTGVTCPTCGSREVTFMASRRVWQCKGRHPKRQFSVKVGTIFEDSAIGLDKWFGAIWMLVNDRNGISSLEVSRAIGVTQKTAWFMLDRIRLAIQVGTFSRLSGQVEVDETFIGGKARFMHKDRRAAKIKGTGGMGKAVVMRLLERHGEFRYRIIPNTRRHTLDAEVKRSVESGSHLFTDALASYDHLAADDVHKVIDHAERYVDGNIHTNSLENFWSQLKRALHGTYVSVQPFHLFRYLDEQTFRFNNRVLSDCERFGKA